MKSPHWQQELSVIADRIFKENPHGDMPRWQAAINNMPGIKPSLVRLDTDSIQVGTPADINESEREQLVENLKQFMPWRKGPFDLFGIHIDTEWRSDWKWDRIKDHIAPLKGRTVLDVGCGSGYHCWRMAGEGADYVIGIEPMYLYLMQFNVMQRYIQDNRISVLPLGIDDVPENMQVFDTIFSMGVLYHRKSPQEHLNKLRGLLKDSGELVLETLIIEGDGKTFLKPDDRYARMNNVHYIPTTTLLEEWLSECGYKNIRTVNVCMTTTEEQHATDWMVFQSLEDFLDPEDQNKTVEGYPAPVRAVVIANR